jgi:hypothetical protein
MGLSAAFFAHRDGSQESLTSFCLTLKLIHHESYEMQ